MGNLRFPSGRFIKQKGDKQVSKQSNPKSLPRHTPVPPVVEVSPDSRTEPPSYAVPSKSGHLQGQSQFKHHQNPATSLPSDSVVSDSQSAVDRVGLRKGK
jgi:hypothetical protein